MIPSITAGWTAAWAPTRSSGSSWPTATPGQKVIVDGVFNHVGRDFFAFKDLQANRENARYKDWFCDVNFWGNNEYNDGFLMATGAASTCWSS